MNFRKYADRYNIDLNKVKNLLEKSGYLTFHLGNDFENFAMYGEYIGCELDMQTFRDLMGMSPKTRDIVNKVLTSRLVASTADDSSRESER